MSHRQRQQEETFQSDYSDSDQLEVTFKYFLFLIH